MFVLPADVLNIILLDVFSEQSLKGILRLRLLNKDFDYMIIKSMKLWQILALHSLTTHPGELTKHTVPRIQMHIYLTGFIISNAQDGSHGICRAKVCLYALNNMPVGISPGYYENGEYKLTHHCRYNISMQLFRDWAGSRYDIAWQQINTSLRSKAFCFSDMVHDNVLIASVSVGNTDLVKIIYEKWEDRNEAVHTIFRALRDKNTPNRQGILRYVFSRDSEIIWMNTLGRNYIGQDNELAFLLINERDADDIRRRKLSVIIKLYGPVMKKENVERLEKMKFNIII